MNKSEIREVLFKLVYSLEVQKNENDEQIDVFLENIDASDKVKEDVKETTLKIVELNSVIEKEIEKNLKAEWNLERVSKINLAILKIAIYEIVHKKLPYKISINEAVELAKKYGEDTSASFINGILASVVKDKKIAEE